MRPDMFRALVNLNVNNPKANTTLFNGNRTSDLT